MKYIIMILTPVMCLYFVYKTLIALAVNASRISREEEYTSFKVKYAKEASCPDCDCYDSDYGQCTMPSIDRPHARTCTQEAGAEVIHKDTASEIIPYRDTTHQNTKQFKTTITT